MKEITTSHCQKRSLVSIYIENSAEKTKTKYKNDAHISKKIVLRVPMLMKYVNLVITT